MLRREGQSQNKLAIQQREAHLEPWEAQALGGGTEQGMGGRKPGKYGYQSGANGKEIKMG